MHAAGQKGLQPRPIPFDRQAQIVLFPRAGNFRIDSAGFSIPQLLRLPIGIQRAEHRFERAQLAAAFEHVVHLRKGIEPNPHLVVAARQRTPMSRFVDIHVLRRIGIQIDPLEIAEIDGVRRGCPHAAKNVGIVDHQPQRRPAAGTVAEQESRVAIGDSAVSGDRFRESTRAPAIGRAGRWWRCRRIRDVPISFARSETRE